MTSARRVDPARAMDTTIIYYTVLVALYMYYVAAYCLSMKGDATSHENEEREPMEQGEKASSMKEWTSITWAQTVHMGVA